MEKTMVVKPYDSKVVEDLTTILLWKDMESREDGLMEIPAATYQLGVNILEAVKWEVTGEDNKTIKKALGILEHLREEQKWSREWKRKTEGK